MELERDGRASVELERYGRASGWEGFGRSHSPEFLEQKCSKIIFF